MFVVVGRAEVEAQERAVEALGAAFDPDSIPLSDVGPVSSSLARMGKLIHGARTRSARRVAEAGDWAREGHRSPEEALAAEAGCSLGQARATLGTSRRLSDLGQVSDALREGRLSPEQAEAVADAARADPSAEERLVERATSQSLTELREECRRTKAAADPDPDATWRRIRAGRYLRRRTDGEGAYCLALRTTPEDGARLDAALAPVIERRFAEARAAGSRESAEAYAADALVEAVTRGGTDGKPSRGAESKVLALIDYEALRRGSVEGEERCELVGVGPVPVSTVRSMLTDAFLALVVTDGVDVYSVAHAGHAPTAHQRSALEARGYRCEVPGCGVRHGLQVDHLAGYAVTRRTALDDLAWECRHHHLLKTHHGHRLEGPPTARRWLGPDGTVVATDHVPPPATGPPSPGEATLFDDTDAA